MFNYQGASRELKQLFSPFFFLVLNISTFSCAADT